MGKLKFKSNKQDRKQTDSEFSMKEIKHKRKHLQYKWLFIGSLVINVTFLSLLLNILRFHK